MSQAVESHTAGDLRKAERLYREVLKRDPRNADAYHLLGIIAHQIGQNEPALQLVGHAISLNPSVPAFHNNIGEICKALGHSGDAMAHYRRAISLDGDYPEARNNLGTALQGAGLLDEAIASYREAIGIKPDYAEAHNNLGVALHETGDIEGAIASSLRATAIRPHYMEAYNTLGIALRAAGRAEEAAEAYRKALSIDGQNADSWNNLGVACKDLGRFADEMDCYRQVLSLYPDFADAHYNMGCALQEDGMMENAAKCLARSYTLRPRSQTLLRIATMLPVIPRSTTDIKEARANFEAGIDELEKSGVAMLNPAHETEPTGFYLSYHGLCDRALNEKLARFYEKACPSLLFTSPRIGKGSSPSGPNNNRIRIGFISKFLRNHTVGHYVRGIISNLSKDLFDITLFLIPQPQDEITRSISAHADRTVALSPHFEKAREEVSDAGLDVLVYADIGMEPFSYFMAFARLAPLQCAFYGHPDTTGIGNIDYFISHEDCETAKAREHYTEKLFLLPGSVAYTCFHRPGEAEGIGGADHGGEHIYLCPQSLFKIHPDFDRMAAAILRADPGGVLAIFAGHRPSWTQLLMERFGHVMPDVTERVRVLPRQSYRDFLCTVSAAHVMLDTPHFNGGNTSFDAFAMGTPVVTLPGEFMRGRQTSSLYKRMGITNCVADDEEEYVTVAVNLACNASLRRETSEEILARNHLIFNDVTMVKELERFFIEKTRQTVHQGGPHDA